MVRNVFEKVQKPSKNTVDQLPTKLNFSHQTYWLKIVNVIKLLDSLSIIYYSCGSISKASSFRWLLWIAQTEVVQIVFSGVKSYDGPQSMNTNDIRWMRHKLF